MGRWEDAISIYSKLEKVPDSLLKDYFELLTNLHLDSLHENPWACQKRLAVVVVAQFHGREAALTAQQKAQAIVTQVNTE